jgi:hypothetical protein
LFAGFSLRLKKDILQPLMKPHFCFKTVLTFEV